MSCSRGVECAGCGTATCEHCRVESCRIAVGPKRCTRCHADTGPAKIVEPTARDASTAEPTWTWIVYVRTDEEMAAERARARLRGRAA